MPDCLLISSQDLVSRRNVTVMLVVGELVMKVGDARKLCGTAFAMRSFVAHVNNAQSNLHDAY